MLDEATHTLHHEDPMCEGFEQKMKELRMKPTPPEVTVFVDEVGLRNELS